MRRHPLVSCSRPAVLALAILTAAACDVQQPIEPAGLAPVGADLHAAPAGPPGTVDILSFADDSKLGEATLRRDGNGVTLRAHMEAETGEAFTVWSAVFNNPDECAASPCALGDLGDPDVEANVIRITGGIAGGTGLSVAGRLQEGDASEGLFPGGPPLMDATKAEIHFIYRSHGQKVPGQIDDQIMTVGGACATNTCMDVAFSIHLP